MRVLLAFLPLALLTLLVAQFNHIVAPWHVYFFSGGLSVIFAALRLDFASGFVAVFLSGLLADAGEPLLHLGDHSFFGVHAFLYAAALVLIFSVRGRLPHEETLVSVMFALFANLGIFAVFSLLFTAGQPEPFSVWTRLLVDLVCSQVLIAVIAPWFFALQARVFSLGGFELRGR
ncbi:MAG TPA: hypothetical protein VFB27_12165 [Opitutaceae bacterium]|nr:hypothetical protein [Opitutaceae bacterium]